MYPLIARDPAAALKALDDPKQYADLPPAVRELQRERAKLAQQKASFAAVGAIQSDLADGTKTAEDIDALLKDGAIGEATGAWLKKQAERSAKEKAEKAAGRERVQGVLDEGGKLDPKKAGDRAANDAYYDAVVAPGKPDAATLVAYVAKTGMVPETLGRRLRGGLASDDPQQAVNAASLLVELGKQDGTLTEGFGAKRLRFAKAVMAGIDGGLSPERAVALATKRHGEPDPGDDDDTQIAEAEGDSAGEREKAKVDGAEGDNAKETTAEKNNGQRPQDQTQPDEAEKGGTNGSTEEPTKTGAGGDQDDESRVDDKAGSAIAADIKEQLAAAGYRYKPDAGGQSGLGDWRDADGNPIDAGAARQIISEALIKHAARDGMSAGEFLARRQRLVEGVPQDRAGETQVALVWLLPALAKVAPWLLGLLTAFVVTKQIDDNLKRPTAGRHAVDPEPPTLPGGAREAVRPAEVTTPGRTAEEGKPTVMVTPLLDPEGPAIEIFPDMSDELEQWLYLESRGKAALQQKDLKFILSYLYDGLAKRGQQRKHIGGGYDVETGEYRKERVYQREARKNKGSRRSDGTIEIGEGAGKETLDVNVVDTRADGRTITRREQEALEAIKELKKLVNNGPVVGDTIDVAKSKGWTWDEWTEYVKYNLDKYLDSKYGRPKQ